MTVPTGRGSTTRTPFSDMQLFDLAVIPWPERESGLLMGVGPVFIFPTATEKLAGQGAWQRMLTPCGHNPIGQNLDTRSKNQNAARMPIA